MISLVSKLYRPRRSYFLMTDYSEGARGLARPRMIIICAECKCETLVAIIYFCQ